MGIVHSLRGGELGAPAGATPRNKALRRGFLGQHAGNS
jgi:hypothetical protein